MASQGPLTGSSASVDNSFGTKDWTNPSSVLVQDTSDCAFTNTNFSLTSSYYLVATGFGFSVPAGATIDGIEVTIYKFGADSFGGAMTTKDSKILLVKNGVIGSFSLADTATVWPPSNTPVAYGGPSSLWSETWSYTDINASNFGVALSASIDFGDIAWVDAILVTVYYTAGASGSGLLVGTQLTGPLLVSGGLVR